MKRIQAFCKKHYFLASILAAMLLALPMILALSYSNGVAVNGALSQKIQIVVIFDFLICWPVLAVVAAYPLVLTGIECLFLLRRPDTLHRTQEQVFDALTLLLGAAYTPFYLCFNLNTTRADWPETLRGYALHTPLAFLLMWPLLGILICLLALFGQSPSAAIRAFTETSDWNLSQQVSPRNIVEYDEHYLCTVAAGGHRKIVHPIRRGVRHGHSVTVNRQLCVANAFEQILEEQTPRLHRAVRHFYDTYGFPIAKLIRSPYVADLVYFLMKPLEWYFLLVLYSVDAHPEDRIAIQYTGKSVHDFE